MRLFAAILAAASLAGCANSTLPTECPTNQAGAALSNPSLEPSVWDDGQNTFFRFPGNSRIPTFFTVNPDGKEATASFTADPEHNLVVVHQTAPEFKLRDGNTLACIFNNAWNPVGYQTGTGTTNPNVVRDLKGKTS